MTDDPRELARLLGLVADAMASRGGSATSAGIVRRAARLLATMPTPIADDACAVCGGSVTQPDRGRRRLYCSTTCRRRAENQRRNGNLAA